MNRLLKVFTNLFSPKQVATTPKLPPPQEPLQLAETERRNQKILLKFAEIHGPIFRATDADGDLVCVIGLWLGRRFLKEHATSLRPVTLDIKALVPEGFMRQMEGSIHKKYRKALTDAVSSLNFDQCEAELEIIVNGELQSFARDFGSRRDTAREYLSTLTKISTAMLIRIFFGVVPGTEGFDRLVALFQMLGPHGLVWNIKKQQISAFSGLRDELRGYVQTDSCDPVIVDNTSILRIMALDRSLDDTSLGNLIYMVEMGRYDMKGLFRWISKYGAENPEWLSRIANAESEDTAKATSLARAFVLETLRMDQSERLMRDVKKDIVFDGFLIPKGWRARICMWESHKDGATFDQPFVFDPNRFLSNPPTTFEFSPFGLDHHYCPFAITSISLGVLFLRCLSRDYWVTATDHGDRVRGGYHWEPALNFSVLLTRRPNDNARFSNGEQ